MRRQCGFHHGNIHAAASALEQVQQTNIGVVLELATLDEVRHHQRAHARRGFVRAHAGDEWALRL
jgi:hypothetical protein